MNFYGHQKIYIYSILGLLAVCFSTPSLAKNKCQPLLNGEPSVVKEEASLEFFESFGPPDLEMTQSLNKFNDSEWVLQDSETVLFIQVGKSHNRLIRYYLKTQSSEVLIKNLSPQITHMSFDPTTKRVYLLSKVNKPYQKIANFFWDVLFVELNDPLKKVQNLDLNMIQTQAAPSIPNVSTKSQIVPEGPVPLEAYGRMILATSSSEFNIDSRLTLLKHDFPAVERWNLRPYLEQAGLHAIQSYFFQFGKHNFILIKSKEGLFLMEESAVQKEIQLPHRLFPLLTEVDAIGRDSHQNIVWVVGKTQGIKILFAFDLMTQKPVYTQELQYPEDVQKVILKSTGKMLVFEFFQKSKLNSFKLAIPAPDLTQTLALPFVNLSTPDSLRQLHSQSQLKFKSSVLPLSGKLVQTGGSSALILVNQKLVGINPSHHEFQNLQNPSAQDKNGIPFNKIQSAAASGNTVYFMQAGLLFKLELDPLNIFENNQLTELGDISYSHNSYLRVLDNQSLETILDKDSVFVLSDSHLRRFQLTTGTKTLVSANELAKGLPLIGDTHGTPQFLSGDVQNHFFYFTISTNNTERPAIYSYDLEKQTLRPLIRWASPNNEKIKNHLKVKNNKLFFTRGSKLIIYSIENQNLPVLLKEIDFTEPITDLYINSQTNKYYVTLQQTHQLIELDMQDLP